MDDDAIFKALFPNEDETSDIESLYGSYVDNDPEETDEEHVVHIITPRDNRPPREAVGAVEEITGDEERHVQGQSEPPRKRRRTDRVIKCLDDCTDPEKFDDLQTVVDDTVYTSIFEKA